MCQERNFEHSHRLCDSESFLTCNRADWLYCLFISQMVEKTREKHAFFFFFFLLAALRKHMCIWPKYQLLYSSFFWKIHLSGNQTFLTLVKFDKSYNFLYMGVFIKHVFKMIRTFNIYGSLFGPSWKIFGRNNLRENNCVNNLVFISDGQVKLIR